MNEKRGISGDDTHGWVSPCATSRAFFIRGQALLIRGDCEHVDDVGESVH